MMNRNDPATIPRSCRQSLTFPQLGTTAPGSPKGHLLPGKRVPVAARRVVPLLWNPLLFLAAGLSDWR